MKRFTIPSFAMMSSIPFIDSTVRKRLRNPKNERSTLCTEYVKYADAQTIILAPILFMEIAGGLMTLTHYAVIVLTRLLRQILKLNTA